MLERPNKAASSVHREDADSSPFVATKPKASLLGLFCVQKRGHNPPLDDVDATDSDKRSEWGERDLLQDIAYKNDRQVKEKHIYHHLDKENPRCEIVVEKIKPPF